MLFFVATVLMSVFLIIISKCVNVVKLSMCMFFNRQVSMIIIY